MTLVELLRQAQWHVPLRSPLWWAIERALEPSKEQA